MASNAGGALPHQTDPSQHEVNKQVSGAGTQTGQGHEHQSDLNKMKMEDDGSFKRKASTFRNWIAADSEFAPEKGKAHPNLGSELY